MTQVIDVDGTVISPTCVHWKVSFTSPESSVTHYYQLQTTVTVEGCD